MAKLKLTFNCTACGAKSPKWEGKCNTCGEWNTLVEEKENKSTIREERKSAWQDEQSKQKNPTPLQDITVGHTIRIITSDTEFNRVLGGGIVTGSLILLGGQPGIGKSTLLLQMALRLKAKLLYVSGEESEEQIKMRANRVGATNQHCYIYSETNVVTILKKAKTLEPEIIVIDSIQTLASPFVESTPGTVTQIRETTAELQRFAKDKNIPIIIVGHITKDGSIAGPKLLEHMVDVVLQFEGDQQYSYRILRTLKNRFGSTNEIGIYEMNAQGLRMVSNPSELLLSQGNDQLSGSAVAASIEGLRPILIETQALVSPSVYGTPQRSATGFDLRRLSMLLAVLEKRCGLPFGQNDVFLNIAGGIKIMDPAIDLALVAALISSLENISVSRKIAFAGEVGLSGEVRAVSRIEQRILEADRLGFDQICISQYNLKGLDQAKFNIEIISIKTIVDLLEQIFS